MTMSFTITVPVGWPSLRYNSIPVVCPRARKINVPLALKSSLGIEELAPGKMSDTITVPDAVPSDFQSSKPVVD